MSIHPPGATFCKTCGYCLHALTVNRCPECGHDFDPANPKTFRTRPLTHRLKWVVRAAVVVLLLAAVPVGYWGWMWWGWKQEQPVIARLTAKGASINTTIIGPEWVKRWIPEKAAFVLVRANEAMCESLPVTDGDLLGLESLTELEVLELWEAQVTDASLPAVGRLTKLRTLGLWGCPITDQGLKNLRELKRLETLALGGPRISGQALEYLKQNAGMRMLNLGDMQIGDESVETILVFTKLEEIGFGPRQFSDAGLLKLGRLPALRRVLVIGPGVTDAGMDALRKARPDVVVTMIGSLVDPTIAPAD